MSQNRRLRTWLAWSVFAFALTGLGFALDAWWPPQPRWVLLRGDGDSFDLLGDLSPDGTILTTQTVRHTKGGGLAYESVKAWDTISGRQRGEFFADSVPPRFSPLDALLQQQIETKGLEKPVNLQTALKYLSDKAGGKLMFLVDRAAFVTDLGGEAPDLYEEEVSLPASPKMAMSTALDHLLSQVGKGTAAYVVRHDFVEIMPTKRRFDEKLLPPFARDTFIALAEPGQKANKLHVVDAASGKIVASLSTHAGTLNIWGFTPDRELLFFFATEEEEPLLSVWSTRTRQVVRTFEDIDLPKLRFSAFTLAPDGLTLLAVQTSGRAELLNLRTGERRRLNLGMNPHGPFDWRSVSGCAVFSPDSKTLVALTKTELQIWDVPTGAKRRSIKLHLADPKSRWNEFCFSEDWSMCAGMGSMREFKVWNLETGQCLWQREGPEPHRDGSICRFLTQRMTDRIDILDFSTGEARASVSLGENSSPEQSITFTPNGRSIITSWRFARQRRLADKWLGDRWRLNRSVGCLVVADAVTGQIQFRSDYGLRDRERHVEISDDGETLVEFDQYEWIARAGDEELDEFVQKFAFWDLPLRAPRLVVYGIPFALAVIVVLVRFWFRRKRGKAQLLTVALRSV